MIYVRDISFIPIAGPSCPLLRSLQPKMAQNLSTDPPIDLVDKPASHSSAAAPRQIVQPYQRRMSEGGVVRTAPDDGRRESNEPILDAPAPVMIALMPSPTVPAVKIHLKPIGATPALAKSKFKVPAAEPFVTILGFLRKQLGLSDSEALWCFLHSSFAPSPSCLVGDLFRSFQSESELVVHYSLTQAFG
jgi:Ubiquitin-like autophagy protein Apg12